MSAKMATAGLLKITVFWNKGYDVIIPYDDVTNQTSSRDSNYVVDVFMWPKFGNSSISMREVITTSILQGFNQKNCFFWGVVSIQVQYFGTGTRYKLEILHQCCKRVITKSQKVLGVNSYACRSYRREKLVGGGGGGLFASPSWIGLTIENMWYFLFLWFEFKVHTCSFFLKDIFIPWR